MKKITYNLHLIVWVLLLAPHLSNAQEGLLNKLLAPGPLIEGHKDLEHKDCLECHIASEGIPNEKCLVCHKEIQASIDRKNSYHGKQQKKCHECHSDHKGRKYDSLSINEKEFKHIETGYELLGKHAKIKCTTCHNERRSGKLIRKSEVRWFGKEQSCLECHRKDDVHFFTQRYKENECSRCHGQVSWKENLNFDHNKDTNYPLFGKHTQLKCEKCHTTKDKSQAKYQWEGIEQRKCLSCHQDMHKENLSLRFRGGQCDRCHNQNTWSISAFDHSITGYELKGKHQKIECLECHNQKNNKISVKDRKWTGVNKSCISCHKNYHAFPNQASKRYGSLLECEQCHNYESFKFDIDFNHNYDTRFKIDGKHLKNKCFDCHKRAPGEEKRNPKRRIYHWKVLDRKTCETCHKSPHRQSFSKKLLTKKCTSCHVTDGWHVREKADKKIGFSHDSTRFSLTGKHRGVKCEKCHVNKRGKQQFKFPMAEKQFCQNCHSNVHKDQFSRKFLNKSCGECHTTTNFTELKSFNHNKTRFRLTGKHEDIKEECVKCHVKTNKNLATNPPKPAGKFNFGKKISRFCQKCHSNVHSKQFDEKFSSLPCVKCHSTQAFAKRKKFDHKATRFPLRGEHQKLNCSKCHVKTKNILLRKPLKYASRFIFPNLQKKDCQTCHKDPHHGSFGESCSSCHNEKSWQSTRDFHREFTLTGVHFTLQCEECHIDGRRLSGLSKECLICHQKDDVHNAALPMCGDCHRQSYWESPKFNHAMTSFPLRGAHRIQNCNACHKNGAFTGMGFTCASCHNGQRKACHPHPMLRQVLMPVKIVIMSFPFKVHCRQQIDANK
ncbi:MAG: hypothetical protein R3B45_17860 [Bdellovibrionota bacterium]